MTEAEALRLLAQTGAIQYGHFILSSGLHSGRYFQCALALQHPEHAERLCGALARRLQDAKAQVVVGPAVGGIIVAYELARQLGVRSMFAERQDGAMTLRRGFTVGPGERAVIAEDVITTGGSVLEVASLLRSLGAEVVSIAALLDRTGGVDLGVRLEALARVTVETYSPESCPLCARGLAASRPGSRMA